MDNHATETVQRWNETEVQEKEKPATCTALAIYQECPDYFADNNGIIPIQKGHLSNFWV